MSTGSATESTGISLNAEHKKIFTKKDGVRRPNYSWGVLHGAYLAANLGIPRVSVLEFGVAGGNGLVSLELIAADVESLLGVGIDVYGFDLGSGFPEPVDYRDSPNLFQAGAFPMDVEKLRARLTKRSYFLATLAPPCPSSSRPALHRLPLYLSISICIAPQPMHCAYSRLRPSFSSRGCIATSMTYWARRTVNSRASYWPSRSSIRGTEARKIAQIRGLRHYVLPDQANQSWVDAFYLVNSIRA